MEYARKHDETQWGKGRRSKTGAKASLLLSGDDGMVQTALITPMLASIALAFPQASELLLDWSVSITALMTIPAMLLTSFLARRFNKKHIIMFGTVLFMLAGLSASLTPSLEVLVVQRAVLGIGAGLAFPLVPSSIAYLFSDHEKNQMLGWMNSVGALLSFTLSFVAGIVTLYSWRASFLFYLIFVPILFLQWLFLPNFKPERLEAQEEKLDREPVNAKMWLACLGMLGFMVLAMVTTFKLSLFVENNGLGTSANSGAGISCMTCASFFISLFFAQFYEKLKAFSGFVSLAFEVGAFVMLSLAENMAMVYAGMILQGFCMGTLNPHFMSIMSNVAPDSRKTLGMTMMCMAQLAGQIFTPYYMLLVNGVGFTTDRALFAFTAGIFAFVAVGTLIAGVMQTAGRRKNKAA